MSNSQDKLARIRAMINEQSQNENTRSNKGSGLIYPFWNIPSEGSTTIRFLPDGNSDNPLLWLENNIIRLAFPGIKGMEPKPFELRVPCVEMWGEACPILGHIRKEKWFDDEDTKALGSQYWKKRSWITHGFVVDDGIGEEETPENPIRQFAIGYQLFQLIKSGVMDPDLEDSPDDYEAGTDFVIRKTQQGGNANYTTSSFKRKARSLSDEERDAIEKFGLKDLNDYRPKKPTAEELTAIFEMFQASLNGEMYDANRFGHLPWRPRGVNGDTTTPAAETSSPVVPTADSIPTQSAPVETEVEEDAPATAASTDVNAILAKVRSKTNN